MTTSLLQEITSKLYIFGKFENGIKISIGQVVLELGQTFFACTQPLCDSQGQSVGMFSNVC